VTKNKDIIIELIAATCEVDINKIDIKSSMSTIEEWDSLKQMDIILNLEEKFNVEFADIDIIELTSVALLVEFISNEKL
jgi:acyl carrier protein